MKTYHLFLLIFACLAIFPSCYSQTDSIKVNKSERKVIIKPNPCKDSTLISISGKYDISTLRISICPLGGMTVMEFVPKHIPYKLVKGDLAPGRYYVRCIDKYGRIPSKKMTIRGEPEEESE